MKKRITALLCALVLTLSLLPTAAALEGDTQTVADTLATLGVVQGNGSDYALNTSATRAHAAVLLVRLAGREAAAKQGAYTSRLKDIPAWASAQINYAVSQGWLTGATETAFLPNNPLTANAWCTMLLRMLGYSDKAGDFTVEDAAKFARRIGLISHSYEGNISRGDVFEMMYDALFFSYKDGSGTVAERLAAGSPAAKAAVNALGLTQKKLTVRQIADRYQAAVVCLQSFSSTEKQNFETLVGNASAFFISPDGLAVTNNHSVAGGPSCLATTVDGETYPVEEVLYYDAAIDIAVVRISRTALSGKTTSAFAYLELVGTEEISTGDTVYAISNPLGLGLTVSSGTILATARKANSFGLPCVVNNADISQGSSGGPLMNEYGHVIAITSGAYVGGNSMYLAVPVDPAMKADLNADPITIEELAEITAKAAKEAEKEAN